MDAPDSIQRFWSICRKAIKNTSNGMETVSADGLVKSEGVPMK